MISVHQQTMHNCGCLNANLEKDCIAKQMKNPLVTLMQTLSFFKPFDHRTVSHHIIFFFIICFAFLLLLTWLKDAI